MSAAHLVSLVLLWAGVAVTVLSCVALLVLPTVYDKLHAVAPASSLGAVLVGVSLAVESGAPHSMFTYLLTAALLVASGPVVGIATARAALTHGTRQPRNAPR